VARIVCQISHRADRITFLWSDGSTSFEPYHLEGQAHADLLSLSAQIHASLAHASAADLAKFGHELYRAIFRLGASDPGSASAVHTWVQSQLGSIERIEFLSDMPGVIPWNVLLDDATGDVASRFWGMRFSLGAGRRFNVLRQTPVFESPTPLAATDVDADQTASTLLSHLRGANQLVHSITSLADEVGKNTPDVLWLLVRFEHGTLRLGSDTLDLAELRSWIDDANAGNPEPIVILSASGAVADQTGWARVIESASALFSGLVANEALLSAPQAQQVGQAILSQFLDGNRDLGAILRAVRAEQGSPALAFSAFCPPQIRACSADAADAPLPEFVGASYPLPMRPFHPFAAYQATERALFQGRDVDVRRTAALLDRAGTQTLVLHGSPAVGKTSFLQAGLLPLLEQESIGYRVLRDRTPGDGAAAENDYPILILRATNDLAGQFADALSAFCAQPYRYTTPAGANVTVDLPSVLNQAVTGMALPGASPNAIQASSDATGIRTSPDSLREEDVSVSPQDVWSALERDPALLGRTLDAITKSLPFELVIVVDQGEELLTLVRTSQQRERRRKAIAMLQALSQTAPRCKIIYALRSQSLGQFLGLFPGEQAPTNWRTAYLRPLTETEMVEAMLWPTNKSAIPYATTSPFAHYGFAFEEGFAQKTVRDAITIGNEKQMSPLPIIHAVGALIFEKQVIEQKSGQNLKALGEPEDALDRTLEQSLQRLPMANSTRAALRNLVSALTLSQNDGTLGRDLVLARDLQKHWKDSGERVEAAVNQAADEVGLFEIQNLLIGGKQDLYVSLPQDSLAQLGKQIEGEGEIKKAKRSNTIDVLWIMIPLVFLAAAVSYWATRNFISPTGSSQSEESNNEKSKLIQQQAKQLANFMVRQPLYHGVIAQADQAWRAENALRTRQLLLSQPASRAFDDVVEGQPLPDLRGFEWRYLWRQLNSERYLLAGHRGSVDAVAVSPDGKWAASASERSDAPEDGTIRIWNLATGEIAAKIVGPKITVHALAFAPDSKSLASAGSDKLIRVWDLAELTTDFVALTKDPKTLSAHEGAITALAFGKDAQTLASAGADKTVLVWDVASSKPRHSLKEHTAAVTALAFYGGKLVSAAVNAECIVWDADAGKKSQTIKNAYQSIASLGISSDGKTLCTAGIETKFDADLGMVRFWSLDYGSETGTAIHHGSGIHAVALHPDGKSVASAGTDHVVRSWAVATGKPQQRWLGHLGAVHALAFAKDGSALLSGSADRTVKVWNTANSDVITAAHADWVQCLALDDKNTIAASGARDGSVKLWDVASAKMLHQLPAHNGSVTSLAFSHHADKSYLAVATRTAKNEGEIKIWQIERDAKQAITSKDRHALKGHQKGVNAVTFNPRPDLADMLVSASADHTVKLWDIVTGKEKETYRGHKDEVRAISFAPDGKGFASGGKDALVCIHSLTGKELWTLTDLHLNSIETLAFFQYKTRDGAVMPALFTGSADQTTRIWDFALAEGGRVDDKRELRHFRTHTQPICSVVQNVATGMMASASWDGAIKLYDIDGERFTLLGHHGPVRALALTNNQSLLISAGNDGTVRFWRAPHEKK
jgi:WD40 repeat protein